MAITGFCHRLVFPAGALLHLKDLVLMMTDGPSERISEDGGCLWITLNIYS